MNRTVRLLFAAGFTALAAGCSSHSSVPPAAASAASLPSGCASALAALPGKAPDTVKQAADDTDALGGRKGTTAGSLADAVSADSFSIGFDLSENLSAASAAAKWQADAAALRAYCS
jgi:hypothetical protein